MRIPKLYSFSRQSIMAECWVRPLGDMLDRKWRHHSIPWPDLVCRPLKVFVYLTVQNLCKIFNFSISHAKFPLKFLGKGKSPPNNFFIDQTPKRHLFESIRIVWGINYVNQLSSSTCGREEEDKLLPKISQIFLPCAEQTLAHLFQTNLALSETLPI